ncbi:MAG TPA: hypothetical protein VH394_28020 [Thermoanaerobaculia bacterium]|nr:hypothetical protein [Thermoanaerobaculia bacterium]
MLPKQARTTPARQASATPRFSPPTLGAAATISGDGVSPAARAAARGWSPGSAAASRRAEAGRVDGSSPRHWSTAASTRGSSCGTKTEGGAGRFHEDGRPGSAGGADGLWPEKIW